MMKTPITILSAACCLAVAAHAAEVPSLINYQGRLTDSEGSPVNGPQAMSLAIYDAQTGGNLLYAEDLGSVQVTDGIYSFQFGAAGTSNAATSETVAITDGSTNTFQKVVSSTPVVSNSVSATDGTYTWSQTGGSSDEENFTCIWSSSLHRITVIYPSGAPAAGITISVSYSFEQGGIAGALASGAEHWLALSIGGVTQTNRERVLAVPFAKISDTSFEADHLSGQSNKKVLLKDGLLESMYNNGRLEHYYPYREAHYVVPDSWHRLSRIELQVRRQVLSSSLIGFTMQLWKWDPGTPTDTLVNEFIVPSEVVGFPERSWHKRSYEVFWNVDFDMEAQYRIMFIGSSNAEFDGIHATIDLRERQ